MAHPENSGSDGDTLADSFDDNPPARPRPFCAQGRNPRRDRGRRRARNLAFLRPARLIPALEPHNIGRIQQPSPPPPPPPVPDRPAPIPLQGRLNIQTTNLERLRNALVTIPLGTIFHPQHTGSQVFGQVPRPTRFQRLTQVERCGGKKLRSIFFGLVHDQGLGCKTRRVKSEGTEHWVEV